MVETRDTTARTALIAAIVACTALTALAFTGLIAEVHGPNASALPLAETSIADMLAPGAGATNAGNGPGDHLTGNLPSPSAEMSGTVMVAEVTPAGVQGDASRLGAVPQGYARPVDDAGVRPTGGEAGGTSHTTVPWTTVTTAVSEGATPTTATTAGRPVVRTTTTVRPGGGEGTAPQVSANLTTTAPPAAAPFVTVTTSDDTQGLDPDDPDDDDDDDDDDQGKGPGKPDPRKVIRPPLYYHFPGDD